MAGPALPVLPKDFNELTRHLSDGARREELKQRRAAFNSARARLQKWIQKDRNPLMTKTVKLIAIYLLGCVNFESGRCNPTHETIADEFGISERQVRRLIPKIREAGWISYTRAAYNRPTFYTFHAPMEVIDRIQETDAALKNEREQRRQERNESRSVRTSRVRSVRTSMSAEHKNRTYDNYYSAIEREPIRYGSKAEVGESYAGHESAMTPGGLSPEQQRAVMETAAVVAPDLRDAAMQRIAAIVADPVPEGAATIHTIIDELSTELRRRMS
ncbi:helix-turn-helix protein [Pseudaminobacter salicylatoxidans]|uniref:Helix-turn-helix protein n=1 Tax=Pseudaminobacter salicylatoxidans TaxID=93369 RepID=A0A316BM42_PSESE|nr:helix-turn-helix domain-containing protein [Pseudaminobacter salicylatoxidans]PWJ73845.1 helix-turn-helix protein [Pseudaminobacter salicylatoxidans]